MSDLTRYTRARSARDSEFAEGLESGYENFKDDALMQQASDVAALMLEDVAEVLVDKMRCDAEIQAPER
jgi:hypothetical protein